MADNFDAYAVAAQGEALGPGLLIPQLYRQLRQMAAHSLRRERPGHTLQPTALANEAYLILQRQRDHGWADGEQFGAAASAVIRRILVDHARRRGRVKRGGAFERVELSDDLGAGFDTGYDLVAVHEALVKFASVAPRAAKVVELRFFAGQSNIDIAALLNVTTRTVERDWRFARAWLYRELAGETQQDPGHDAAQSAA